jgi:hypothetical protein
MAGLVEGEPASLDELGEGMADFGAIRKVRSPQPCTLCRLCRIADRQEHLLLCPTVVQAHGSGGGRPAADGGHHR